MNTNVGSSDRLIRILAGTAGLAYYFTQSPEGTLGWGILAVSAIFTLTGLLRWCPLYSLFGMSTCPVRTGKK